MNCYENWSILNIETSHFDLISLVRIGIFPQTWVGLSAIYNCQDYCLQKCLNASQGLNYPNFRTLLLTGFC